MVSQEDLTKTKVLVEALPYIQRFRDNIIVVKYGGSAMKDEELQYHVIEDIVLLKLIGMRPIIVHGGGKEISKWVAKTGIEPHFYNGLRITDADTLEIAKMVLGKVNSGLVSMAEAMGADAVGISGIDGGLLTVEQAKPDGKDIGFVGNVTQVDTKVLHDLVSNDFIPVVYPIAADENGQAYNVNADHAASAIAEAVHADKLVYLSDIRGVYEDPDDPDSVISELYAREAEQFIQNGIVTGGMVPKIENCVDAVKNGVKRVHILDGRVPHSLILEFFTNRGVGTAILSDSERRYYKEK